MSKDTSGQAFPMMRDQSHEERFIIEPGMTLRQWYAGLAMQGTIASQTPDESIDPEMCAKWCFEVADAMIAEGSK